MKNDHNKKIHALISGRVQGVGFRFFTQEVAQSIGLSGEVRNLPDGRVEVWAEGDEALLNSFLAKLRQGPAMSQVENIDVEWHPAGNRYREFTISA